MLQRLCFLTIVLPLYLSACHTQILDTESKPSCYCPAASFPTRSSFHWLILPLLNAKPFSHANHPPFVVLYTSTSTTGLNIFQHVRHNITLLQHVWHFSVQYKNGTLVKPHAGFSFCLVMLSSGTLYSSGGVLVMGIWLTPPCRPRSGHMRWWSRVFISGGLKRPALRPYLL